MQLPSHDKGRFQVQGRGSRSHGGDHLPTFPLPLGASNQTSPGLGSLSAKPSTSLPQRSTSGPTALISYDCATRRSAVTENSGHVDKRRREPCDAHVVSARRPSLLLRAHSLWRAPPVCRHCVVHSLECNRAVSAVAHCRSETPRPAAAQKDVGMLEKTRLKARPS